MSGKADIKKIIYDTLKRYWGYPSFRELQEEIILETLQGRDCLALLPTGGGKSICFQIPGLVLGGLTVVVTPLVSLMKDQVDNLKARRIKAVYLHSGMTSRELRIGWEHILNGHCKFLYISPERLQNDRFCSELQRLDVRLIVVDEAHCISQWGYDFRPSYLRINKLRKLLPGRPVLALTATATPKVAVDICEKLSFSKPNILSKSFVRENISYIVRQTEEREEQLLRILNNTTGSAIVYVRSRKRTRELTSILQAHGIDAVHFHAGLSPEIKDERQNQWKRGMVRVIVATNAFGMGIDKPDVRVVIHYGVPPSLEEYYQEAGRAGRDGKHSYAVILARKYDKGWLNRSVDEAFPPKEDVKKIYERVCNFLKISLNEGYMRSVPFDIDTFCHTFSYPPIKVKSALRILSNSGYMTYSDESDRRSRIMIIVDRHELYDAALNQDCSAVMDTLLRMYPGLFTEYIFINETEIGRRLGISTQEVYDRLLEISRNHLIHYVPVSRLPYIFFDTSREEATQILISRSAYEDRREVMQERISSMLEYLTYKGSCRVDYMLSYFGEKDSGECGKCDICRSRRRRPSTSALASEILTHLHSSPLPLSESDLIRRVGNRDLISDVLRFLCREKYIVFANGAYSIYK